MKKELVDLQPKLEQAKIDNTKMMKVKDTLMKHTHNDILFLLSPSQSAGATFNPAPDKGLASMQLGVCRVSGDRGGVGPGGGQE